MPTFFGLDIGFLEVDGLKIFYYLSRNDHSIHLFNYDATRKHRVIPIDSISKGRIPYSNDEVTGVWLESVDKLWIDSPVADSIYCINPNTLQIIEALDVSVNSGLSEVVVVKEPISPRNPMIRIGDSCYMNLNSFYSDHSKMDLLPNPFFAVGKFKRQNSTLACNRFLAEVPGNYYSANMYVNSSSSMLIGGDAILVNYHYNDSVDLIVNDSVFRRIAMKSDSSKVFSGLQGSMHDMSAVKKLFLMNQRYNNVMFDPGRQLYYRVFVHQATDLNNGKIHASDSWSLLIFNKDFEKVKELFFNSSELDPSLVFVSKNGLLIRDFTRDEKDASGKVRNIYFKRYEIQKG